jgi:hypothetical protein
VGVVMTWKLSGTFYENCSCDAICPCPWSNMARVATNDDCRLAMMCEIDSGSVDGVDVSGTMCVMVAQTPALMPEGNWKVGLVMSELATDEQVDAVTADAFGISWSGEGLSGFSNAFKWAA